MAYRSSDPSRFRPRGAQAPKRYRKSSDSSAVKWMIAVFVLLLLVAAGAAIRRYWPSPHTPASIESPFDYGGIDAVAIGMQPLAGELWATSPVA